MASEKPYDPSGAATGRSAVPTHLYYSYHAFHGPSLDLRLRRGLLVFRRSADGYQATHTEPRIVEPTPRQWRALRRKLDAISIWSWELPAADPMVCDGGNWIIDVRYADRRMKMSGYHATPEHFGRFERALEAVLGLRKLVGEPFGYPATPPWRVQDPPLPWER